MILKKSFGVNKSITNITDLYVKYLNTFKIRQQRTMHGTPMQNER